MPRQGPDRPSEIRGVAPSSRLVEPVRRVEFKINLLEPSAGERLVARGRVIRSGRTLTVCRGDAVTISDGREKHVATLTTTHDRDQGQQPPYRQSLLGG
jgi:acyl-coenzyme A thioesterase PaaI-like protein